MCFIISNAKTYIGCKLPRQDDVHNQQHCRTVDFQYLRKPGCCRRSLPGKENRRRCRRDLYKNICLAKKIFVWQNVFYSLTQRFASFSWFRLYIFQKIKMLNMDPRRTRVLGSQLVPGPASCGGKSSFFGYELLLFWIRMFNFLDTNF